ncbi:sodium ABC transporter ATP-binding protein [Paenibacillus sp. CAA11]|uniref:ABC transporter ATP-binding protein n=1 Tax=Paenibacillus sp. CAA11 TaxID=1532905 RepID=UPI000D3AEA3B|nr:ABC transporter ATP-binding protein [Paenibacillus sp. CAA11]AWB44418.1 sodium ABC transporter ATP-binding protein [Paenibacillus sp. CAA11]
MKNAIEVRGLGKKYGAYALSNVSFDVPKGYITGLIGPNGAGKSTTIKMIMGTVLPDQGSVTVFGQRVVPEDGTVRDKVGFVSDENIFYDYLSMDQMKRIVAPFYSRWNDDIYDKYMTLFELPGKKKIKDCSKGMKMKYAIAIALSHQPELLIMDEPTAGLDPVFRRELLDLLGEYIIDEHKSILFSTHLTADLDRVADYITFLNKGTLVFSDSKEEVTERYVIAKGPKELLDRDVQKQFVGLRVTDFGFEALANNREQAESIFGDRVMYQQPTLEDIMYFTARGDKTHV